MLQELGFHKTAKKELNKLEQGFEDFHDISDADKPISYKKFKNLSTTADKYLLSDENRMRGTYLTGALAGGAIGALSATPTNVATKALKGAIAGALAARGVRAVNELNAVKRLQFPDLHEAKIRKDYEDYLEFMNEYRNK